MSTAEGRPSFLGSLWRLFTFWKLRKALGLIRAGDQQFTGSTDGIRDAFTIYRDEKVTQYNNLEEAVSGIEAALEEKRIELEDLNKEEEELIRNREGALSLIEQAQEAGNDQDIAKHTAAFERFQTRIDEIEARQATLAADIAQSDEEMEGLFQDLTDMQAEIQDLPKKEAEALRDFISSNTIIELRNRAKGLQTSANRGPIDAVLEQNKKLTARARVATKLAGTDVRRQDKQYAKAGRTSVSGDRLAEMLAARKAERTAKTGAPDQDGENEERPQI